jgi:nitroreductase
MNEAINVILARRSIRKYEDKPVEREKNRLHSGVRLCGAKR